MALESEEEAALVCAEELAAAQDGAARVAQATSAAYASACEAGLVSGDRAEPVPCRCS